MKSVIASLLEFIKRLILLFRTHTPISIINSYIFTWLRRSKIKSETNQEFVLLISDIKTLKLKSDFYTGNYPYWLKIIRDYKLNVNNQFKVLEIGSWEGLTSFFILSRLPKCELTCVDTWGGSDEQNANETESDEVLKKIEENFNENTRKFKDRLIKIKSTSLQYFAKSNYRNYYDLIFVDGSHHCDDVIVDTVKAFEQLKVGGLLIFDDYFWFKYKRNLDNPMSAINSVLLTKNSHFKTIMVYEQVIIQKLSDRYI